MAELVSQAFLTRDTGVFGMKSQQVSLGTPERVYGSRVNIQLDCHARVPSADPAHNLLTSIGDHIRVRAERIDLLIPRIVGTTLSKVTRRGYVQVHGICLCSGPGQRLANIAVGMALARRRRRVVMSTPYGRKSPLVVQRLGHQPSLAVPMPLTLCQRPYYPSKRVPPLSLTIPRVPWQ